MLFTNEFGFQVVFSHGFCDPKVQAVQWVDEMVLYRAKIIKSK